MNIIVDCEASGPCPTCGDLIEFAAIAVVVCRSTSSSNRVNVPALEAVLATAMLVITVVVDDGTVYSVATDVAADALTRAFDTVAISYYLRVLVVLLLL